LSSDGILYLSVRGEARQTVAPDQVAVMGRVIAAELTKPQAMAAAAGMIDELGRTLAGLGGVALTPETIRAALTWSAHSYTTQVEREHNPETGRFEPTGKILASVNVTVTARDFDLLDELGSAFARLDGLVVDGVSWHVDNDNPAWATVRALAVEAAIRKGRDYAAALGTSVTGVEQLADAGLLDGGGPGVPFARAASRMVASASGSSDDGEAPSLDPVPQELMAVVEARLRAASVPLD
jgi:uncharacterized protein